MKKKISLIIIAAIAMTMLCVTLSACNPDKIENIVGTYKLTTDTETKYQQDTVDYIQESGREAYIVLTGKDYGYYAYKDNSTPITVREIKLEYTKNDDNEITSITYSLEEGGKNRTFNVNSQKDIYLISRWPSASKIIPAHDTTYTRISDKTDLSTVKNLYPDAPVYEYGVYEYNSAFCAELDNGLQKNFSKYIYKYYDVDASKCTATLYYALRTDKKAVVENNLPVVFTKNENNKAIAMSIGGVEFRLESGLPTRDVTVEVSGEQCDVHEQLSWFGLSQTEYTDYTSYFQSLIDEYENSLKETQPTE